MDEKTQEGEYTLYQHPINDENDALYIDGELVTQGERHKCMAEALKRLGVDTRSATDHIFNGTYVRDLSDIKLNLRTQLRKKAQELEEEGDRIVAALHDIDGQYWGPFDEHE